MGVAHATTRRFALARDERRERLRSEPEVLDRRTDGNGAVGPPAQTRTRRRAVQVALLLAMTVVSLILWIGVPLGWLWVASQVAIDYQGIYLWALFAIPVTMAGVGWVLHRIDLIYVRVSGQTEQRTQTAWLQSQAADRTSRQAPRAIDVIMACSVGLAVTLMAVWFFFLAGSPLP